MVTECNFPNFAHTPHLLVGPPPLVVPSALSRSVSLSLCPWPTVCMERVTALLLSHFIREVSATLWIVVVQY